ncbi:GNAT family N-acetyltransferase [Chitinophaga pinensis]|uniref:GNAT family N-acetyltransferase n=2 Tax=Chitinophaga pinensis TaxID=79329 RepID=A0A5C6LMR4_9BACT|nr:GNAT family N-acetyltransferase [Chitinophaga pinensis]
MHEVSLRALEASDEQRLSILANNPNIARNLRNVFPHPYTPADAQFFISKAQEGAWGYCRAILYREELAGVINLLPQSDVYRHSAEIGYWLGEAYWHKGIMTAAIGMVCRHAFEQYGISRIFAGVFAYNSYSARALEKNGFILEGIKRKAVLKQHELSDEHFYALLNI